MTIKVEYQTNSSKPFPKIMKSRVTGVIALITASGDGTILVRGNRTKDRCVGVYGPMKMGNFEDFNEPLVIQNE